MLKKSAIILAIGVFFAVNFLVGCAVPPNMAEYVVHFPFVEIDQLLADSYLFVANAEQSYTYYMVAKSAIDGQLYYIMFVTTGVESYRDKPGRYLLISIYSELYLSKVIELRGNDEENTCLKPMFIDCDWEEVFGNDSRVAEKIREILTQNQKDAAKDWAGRKN